MTQVEIAKKILEQGNCTGFDCITDRCPFYDKVNSEPNTNCLVWLKNKHSNWCRDINKVKQWLKEKEMIDLTANQIVDPPVKCWIRDDAEDKWMDRWLVAIVDNRYYAIENIKHYETVTLLDAFKYGRCAWNQCSLTDPAKPEFKPWLKVEDIPVELWGKVLFKKRSERNYMANILTPSNARYTDNELPCNLVYLPLGQPLNSEWLEMGEWV